MSRNIVETTEESLEILSYLSSNPETVENLITIFSEKFERQKIIDILSEMADCHLIHTLENTPKEPDWSKRKYNPVFSPNAISINITHKCNLRCIYCYGDGGSFGSRDADMTIDVAKKAVDWVCGNVVNNGQKLASIVFFGGEPLVNFDLIEPVVKYANEVASNLGIKTEFSMTSNGALMTADKANKLAELDVSVLFSIDGPPEIQNYQRPLAGGGDSYSACVNGALAYKDTAKKRISARVTTLGYDLCDITTKLNQAGFNNCFISITSGELGKHYMSVEGVEKLAIAHDDLYKMCTAGLDSEEGVKLIRNNMFVKAITNVMQRKLLTWPCGAGRNYVGISPQGKIYLCHRFVGDEQYCLGDLMKGTFNQELYDQVNIKGGSRSGKCQKCWARMECAGGCYQMNLAFGESLFDTNRHQCELNRRLIEIGIRYYYRLFKKDPEIIRKLCNIKQPIEYRNTCADVGHPDQMEQKSAV